MNKWEDFSHEDQEFLRGVYNGRRADLRKARKAAFKGILTVRDSEWISQRPEVALTASGKVLVENHVKPQPLAPATDTLPQADAGAEAVGVDLMYAAYVQKAWEQGIEAMSRDQWMNHYRLAKGEAWEVHPTNRELEAYGDGYTAGIRDAAPQLARVTAERDAARAALELANELLTKVERHLPQSEPIDILKSKSQAYSAWVLGELIRVYFKHTAAEDAGDGTGAGEG